MTAYIGKCSPYRYIYTFFIGSLQFTRCTNVRNCSKCPSASLIPLLQSQNQGRWPEHNSPSRCPSAALVGSGSDLTIFQLPPTATSASSFTTSTHRLHSQ
ncbi:hypothetical protein GDO78_020054 [Eleutherodactylus coqui]|uniref:Uncharacterized protein n=1 Tax=Eleutherodactylus coqui TaxID=57060 RepID=A0A8J6EIA0_ELECQ|nr:hypothetical protein GDO78_020054 [Eleutherodactylus coqui]